MWTEIAITAIPSIIVSVVAYRINKKADRRYEEQKKQHEERVKAERLSMEMQFSTSELAYASAMALKRGEANGEVEKGVEAYEKAKQDYFNFINAKYVEDITK